MASMWRKAMLYLGLGPDEEYDDYDVTDEHERHVPSRPPPRRPAPVPLRDPDVTGSVRTLPPSVGDDDFHTNGNGVHDPSPRRTGRPTALVADRTVPSRSHSAVVRPLVTGAAAKPHVVGPVSFDDAQEVADKFKVNVPVILNLQGVHRDLSRRIIDFASGLCYGLGGQMERVANQVYLLTPSDVEVSPEDRRRLEERGYEA